MSFRCLIDDEEAVVYHCYDSDDNALYIGYTGALKRRLAQHRRQAAWYPKVARVEVAGPYDLRLAQRIGAGLAYFPERDEFRHELERAA